MKRRQAIKGIGLSLGGILASSSVISILNSCTAKEELWVPTFFGADDAKLLNVTVDLILPKTEDSPSATEVNVPQFIDKFVNEVFEEEDKAIIKQGIAEYKNRIKTSNLY